MLALEIFDPDKIGQGQTSLHVLRFLIPRPFVTLSIITIITPRIMSCTLLRTRHTSSHLERRQGDGVEQI